MEWADIINEVLDEQAQPVAMADVMKKRANDNLMNQVGAGGGWSYGGNASKYLGKQPTPLAGLLNRQIDRRQRYDAYTPAPMPPSSNASPLPMEQAGPKAMILRGLGYPNKWPINVPSYVPRSMNKNVRGPRGFVED